MIGSGGNTGGGECSRSITDFATSAAERMLGAVEPRGLAAGRGLGARRGSAARRGLGARRGLNFFGEALAVVLGALGAAFGRLRAGGTGFASGLRTAGLSLSVAAGLGARRVADTAAASTFRHACFAAFFSVLNNLRACLSCAFAARTWVLAAAARAAAFVAANLSRLTNGERLVI